MRYVRAREIVIDGAPPPLPFWEPTPDFASETVVIVGGGPSHASLDLDLLKGHPFAAVNSACRKVRPIATDRDLLVFNDNSWNENRPELARDWPGPCVSSNSNAKARLGDAVRRLDLDPLVRWLEVLPDHVGASSGHTTACLIARMAAARIVLVGFEAQAVAGRTHGHDDYSQHDLAAFAERYLPSWRALALAFERVGVEVVNATPHSAIDVFPHVELAAALTARP